MTCFSTLCGSAIPQLARSRDGGLDASKYSPWPGYARRADNAICRLRTMGDEAVGMPENASRSTHNAAAIPASRCACCGRRTPGAIAGALPASFNPRLFAHASSSNGSDDPKALVKSIRAARPEWYEKFYAQVMENVMKSYEMQMKDRKAQLFSTLGDKTLDVLELGIGTGPNLKYYAKGTEVNVIGVDPNQHMEKYARAAASAAGLQDSQFKFVHAVGEALPIGDTSVDAVICTLVLCSVKDVAASLREVKRVLRPGGSFLFIEHIAAPVGSSLRFWQDLLNPVQQFVGDGCHLNRNTLDDIRDARFAKLNAQDITVPNNFVMGPHIIGMAQA